jgi:hypothetical protein
MDLNDLEYFVAVAVHENMNAAAKERSISPATLSRSVARLEAEFGVLLFALQTGWFRDKLKVYQYFLSWKNWRYILATRRNSQALRRVQDRDIIGMFSGRIWYDEIGDWKLGLVNHILNAYWNVIKWILRLKTGAAH